MKLSPDARAVMDAMTEGITIIDTEGVLVFGNRAYRNFLNREAGRDIGPIEGKKLRDLRPGARLPEVLEKGEPILHITRQEIKDFYFVNMYPIYQDGVLQGGVSVVIFLEDAYQVRDELEAAEARSRQVLRRINKANGARYTFADIVAESPASAEVKSLAQRAALTDATVLLASESGTGKELYAQAIHNASLRSENVFVAINCSSFQSNMLESELFGYVEGAFTGAKKGGKIGLFEAASGGTLFLDEVSEMDMGLQAKLLRVLQERMIRPVGGVKEIPVDVRIIAACNADLNAYIAEGKFRKDLYYRLNTFPIRIPPLRERPEDISPLAQSILNDLSHRMRRPYSLSVDAARILRRYRWPGNVRELRNVLEFCAYLTPSGVITAQSLPEDLRRGADVADAVADGEAVAGESGAEASGEAGADVNGDTRSLSQRVREFERREILRLLERNGADLKGKKKTASQLGISLASLYNKLQE